LVRLQAILIYCPRNAPAGKEDCLRIVYPAAGDPAAVFVIGGSMISIQLSNISLILGSNRLFSSLSWEIQHNQKVGLIGPNGAGKSSLFKMITGEFTPESGGKITRARGVKVGYLAQQPELDAVQTAFEAALDGNPRYAEIVKELEEVETSLAHPTVYTSSRNLDHALLRQQQLIDEFVNFGGESYPQRVRDMLVSLGLPETDLFKPIGVLSGGQKKLLGLARLLLLQPDVLLLDEPDNHLDLPAKAYLEKFIREYPGAVVIISHDRYLLDAAVTHITEIEDGHLTTFIGSYSEYIIDKELRLARQEELFRTQQHEIYRMEAAIKRLAIWGKLYDNEKFTSRAKAMQNRLDKMEKIEKPILERRRMDLQLNGWRGSNKVLELRSVSKSYAERTILDGVDEVVWHGERVGVIGPNGSGKSVLLRLVLGIEPVDSGEIILGPSVKVGYYAQEHETLDFSQTLVDAVRNTAALSENNAVSFLTRYLFTYKQANQKINELSGGERSRLQLALLVLSGANFLLLDEPTNNLDIASAEVLEQALEDFVGTVMVISHDRYFLDRTVKRILAYEKGCLVESIGGYSDYLIH
jgi:ATP-binding cassette subfamily F protein 3